MRDMTADDGETKTTNPITPVLQHSIVAAPVSPIEDDDEDEYD